MLLKPLLVPFFALTLAMQQSQGLDFLDTGIVFSGPVRFARKDSTTHFTLRDGKSTFVMRVDRERAFSTTKNTSMSYEWAQKLSTATSATFRIADGRDMAPGTRVRPDLLEMVMCLRPAPTERTNEDISYTIRCVSFNEERQVKNATGDLIHEIDFFLIVPNHSPADTFLSRPREILYVRLEP